MVFSAFRQRQIAGVEDFAIFLALGVMGFHMFKAGGQRPATAIGASMALFTYRQLRPVDPVLVRAFLEGFLQFLVFVLLLIGTSLVGFDVLPHDPLLLLVSLAGLWLLGTGLGLVLSVIVGIAPEVGKLVTMLFQPLYFFSGIFFRPDVLPPDLRDWFLLNPVMHGLELMRGATFDGYRIWPDVGLGYLYYWAAVLLFVGLAMHIVFAQRLASR